MSWTDDRVDRLKELWGKGLSCSQIAKQLGGITRNAVIGKAYRLGLDGRMKPSAPKVIARTAYKAPAVPRDRSQANGVPNKIKAGRAKSQPLPLVLGPGHSPDVKPATPVVEREELAGTATLLTLGRHACRWPIGDPLDDSFSFCGRRKDGPLPYCREHAKVAYQPAQPGKKKLSASELARSLRRYI